MATATTYHIETLNAEGRTYGCDIAHSLEEARKCFAENIEHAAQYEFAEVAIWEASERWQECHNSGIDPIDHWHVADAA